MIQDWFNWFGIVKYFLFLKIYFPVFLSKIICSFYIYELVFQVILLSFVNIGSSFDQF